MLEGMNIYWIGGSPCCGKSTISKMLVDEFGFDMYKCDDHLDRYTEIGAKNDAKIMKKVLSMTTDETWLRDVDEQVADEFEYYREALKIIVSDLEKMNTDKSVLVEGAVILPEFIKNHGIDQNHYVCMVPTKEFQLEKYRQRKWVDYILKDSSDKEKAFKNWMNRDIEYAKMVKNAAKDFGQNLIVVDGSKTIDENYNKVKEFFNLTK